MLFFANGRLSKGAGLEHLTVRLHRVLLIEKEQRSYLKSLEIF